MTKRKSKRNAKRRERILGITKSDKAMGERLKIVKPTMVEQVNNVSNAPRIGLGIESSIKPVRIRREDINIHQHTQTDEVNKRHHALYIAGWSLKNTSEE